VGLWSSRALSLVFRWRDNVVLVFCVGTSSSDAHKTTDSIIPGHMGELGAGKAVERQRTANSACVFSVAPFIILSRRESSCRPPPRPPSSPLPVCLLSPRLPPRTSPSVPSNGSWLSHSPADPFVSSRIRTGAADISNLPMQVHGDIVRWAKPPVCACETSAGTGKAVS
jgi:hypothetical protein